MRSSVELAGLVNIECIGVEPEGSQMHRPTLHSPHTCDLRSLLDRRGFVFGAGAAGRALGTGLGVGYTQVANAPDYKLQIAPLRLELAPAKIIDTFAYNGTVPGPLLRLRENRPVSIDIRNDTDVEDIIHWHGLHVPSTAEGAMEEGSPMIDRGRTRRYSFAPKPTGTWWYHSHVARKDLSRSLYRACMDS
jgi:FtsP/CotA-like multicopper oxidase with cupredoxin domain